MTFRLLRSMAQTAMRGFSVPLIARGIAMKLKTPEDSKFCAGFLITYYFSRDYTFSDPDNSPDKVSGQRVIKMLQRRVPTTIPTKCRDSGAKTGQQ
jgi:hypothetical protein